MPRKTATPCDCGCGQADAGTTRLRLVRCDGCGFNYRTTRQWLEAMAKLPECPVCTDVMAVPCLADMFCMSEDVATASSEYADASRRADNRLARAGGNRAKRRTWNCGGCRRFIFSANARCACGFENNIRGNRNEGSYGMPF